MNLSNWLRIQGDRVVAGLLVAAGAISLLIGYLQVSDAVLTTQQIPYVVSGGLFGLLLAGVGAVLWLSADLRDEWRALKRIETELHDLNQSMASEPAAEVNVDRPDRDGGVRGGRPAPEPLASDGRISAKLQ